MITSVAVITEDTTVFFSGSADGSLIKWKLISNHFAPIWRTLDHNEEIVSIDANADLDLIATVSADSMIILRLISTCSFIRMIKPDLQISKEKLTIKQLKLSSMGYIVIILRPLLHETQEDIIAVFSINGELIQCKKTKEIIHAMLIDATGYQILTGGSSGNIIVYDLLSLARQILNEKIDNQCMDQYLRQVPSGSCITSLQIVKLEKCQELVIGLQTGELYTMKCNPKAPFKSPKK